MQTYDDDGFASPEELRDEFMARLQGRLNDPKGAARASAVGRIADERGYARFQAIRDYYHAADRDIRRAGADEWGVSVYEVDWIRLFSPIESSLWADIRQAGAVFYCGTKTRRKTKSGSAQLRQWVGRCTASLAAIANLTSTRKGWNEAQRGS